MAIFFTLVLAAVVGLWLYALRRPPQDWSERQQQKVGRWCLFGGGLALPLGSIAVILAFGIPLGHRMLPLPPPGGKAVQIEVTGHQWWWQVRYPGTDIELRNRVYIPAGTPVDIQLTSEDVVHSFWVPRLGGKTDLIPGHTNTLRLYADEPGEYRGQCVEFCGTGHAHMQFVVTALPPGDFARWLGETQTNE
ncbi:cytochrome c oxidase subunit II [Marinobacter sp. HN1S83]|uniref:cytochrome c oxidase subunit II n=1 Tax=Marinobacter sp. HN1S83 TaxID=3382301 RepID=UPI00387ACE27